jgi:hypothetical protein
MRKALLIIAILYSTVATAQARLGSSLGEIYNEFSDDNPSMNTLEDGRKTLRVTTDRATIDYVFNSNQECNATLILPN